MLFVLGVFVACVWLCVCCVVLYVCVAVRCCVVCCYVVSYFGVCVGFRLALLRCWCWCVAVLLRCVALFAVVGV